MNKLTTLWCIEKKR